ncbi:unnamed protein product [Rotaria socialis]|uniref:VWFA domain-containing protein n=3 Tax=Rotaria TaxID=231623 RepID=A0A817N197_9BILA|nr:unnamed protein product [Rotaria socialis]CAF3578414.1 unnamed protein product [Rotaria socialis]CAF3708054.1 unnamed protein product [Rotaria socialis]CAF4156441.1 unnamed protein product [Rotaria socialis]CAF4173193.1 unnamed protein product [Rotaria socialis]
MFFGSKYVYKYEHSSDESISDDDEIEIAPVKSNINELRSSDRKEINERESPAAPPIPAAAAASTTYGSSTNAQRKKRLRKADTNVVSVKFDRLLQPGEMHAGDPVYCADCGAIASHLSKIQHVENEESKWQCEFCPKSNIVDIEQTDLPKKEDSTYLISPAPVVHGSDMTGVDDSIVMFLIDISGSMSSTTLVQGRLDLPNVRQQQQRAAANFDGARMMRERHQTYVSRLQGVQMAVDANLDKLVKDTPTRRAALLTFNHEITYYGDGTRTEPLVIRGDKLNSADDLLREAGRELDKELKPVSETKAKLTERIYDLEEGGQTALGPSVMFALNIASQRQGSKLVICTDGLANRGLGSLETAQDEKAEEAAKMEALTEGNRFYAGLTERAREKGVSISVITISGTACLLPVIGQMADGTSGSVTIVDLLNIRDEFASILEQKVIASNVEATLIVHRGLYIRDPENPDGKLEKIKRNVGNVTKQTEVSFEFGIRKKEELKEKYNIDIDQLKELPFQVQVIYTAADGSKALRVLTQVKEATERREIAEVHAYRGVIAENHIRSTATYMMQGDDDEDEDNAERISSKWSKPIMQKQRMAYMENLKHRKRVERVDDADGFNERRWKKTSDQLNSYVVASKAKRTPISKASPQSGENPSLLGRISRLITGGATGASSTSGAAATAAPEGASNRSYGFATKKLALYTDKNSEDLYKFKNLSSDYMCSETTRREEEEDDEEDAERNTRSSRVDKKKDDKEKSESP